MLAPDQAGDYVIHITDGGLSVDHWIARLRVAPSATERRLVGHSPRVELDEVEPRFGVTRTRITLRANDRHASATELSFCVDRAFSRMLRAGDEFHVSRTGTGAIGLSVLRAAELVGAAGALTSVPLGVDVVVRTPLALVREAEALLRQRDPSYRMFEYPLEVTSREETRLLHRGRVRLGRYEVFVVHGYLPGLPGTAECGAISLVGVCPDSTAPLTARLLDAADAVQIPC